MTTKVEAYTACLREVKHSLHDCRRCRIHCIFTRNKGFTAWLQSIAWLQEVRDSLEGWAAGGSIPGPKKNVTKDFLQPLMCPFGGRPVGRMRAMPHIKTYCRWGWDLCSVHFHVPCSLYTVISYVLYTFISHVLYTLSYLMFCIRFHICSYQHWHHTRATLVNGSCLQLCSLLSCKLKPWHGKIDCH